MTQPIIVRINRRRCILLGGLFAAMTFLFLPAVTLPVFLGIFDWLIAAGIAIAAFFGWFALYFFGLAAKTPAALRMDAQGISGFYADPAKWDEIKAVKVIKDSKNDRFLGFVLTDPIAFRDRQTAWGRFKSWSNWNGNGAHIVVPQMVLADTDVKDLAQQAQHFLTTPKP